ncbi:MAG: MBL fold metallo-hydrolase [Clostridia bacterium]|nr:MBL fold metallo-hydrolase [Clostridia bacterium]
MTFTALASSSHGNAYIVEDSRTSLLVECGVSYRKLQSLFRLVGRKITDMTACLVSHEHKDHAGCYENILAAGIPVWSSDGTAEALECEAMEVFDLPMGANVGKAERFGTLEVLPFRTLHDARRPVGFLIRSAEDGDKLVFATDTANLRYRFPGVTLLAVEANYSDDILSMCTRLPDKVVRRIRNSHMEIGTLCGWLSTLDLSGCRQIYLLHLSDSTSHEEQFLRQVTSVAGGIPVTACPRELKKEEVCSIK